MANKSIEQEVQFLIETHTKAAQNALSNEDFLARVYTLFVSGDISEKAMQIAKLMYPTQTASPARSYRTSPTSHC